MMMFAGLKWILLGLTCLHMAQAVEPDEILSNKDLESRARDISQNLRCLVCQNESIDESNSPLAADLRALLREQLQEGKSNEDIYQYMTTRYGEFVLLKPQPSGSNWLLYLSGPFFMFIALVAMGLYVRQRQMVGIKGHAPLTEDEERELQAITSQRDSKD